MNIREKMAQMKKNRTMESVKKLSERKSSSDRIQTEPLFIKEMNLVQANSIEGDFRFRILPPFFESDRGHWAFPIETHYNVGINNKMFHCPKRMTNGRRPCPICNEVEKLTDPEQRKANKMFYPGSGSLVYVIDRNDEKAGPKLWRMPFSVEREILTKAARADILDLDDTEEGYDMVVSYSKDVVSTGSGKGKTLGKWSALDIERSSSPLSRDEDQAEEWLEFCDEFPLDKVFILYDNETILKAHTGEEELADHSKGTDFSNSENSRGVDFSKRLNTKKKLVRK